MVSYNKQEFNRVTGSTLQSAKKNAPIVAYEIIKWVVAFIKDMYKMIVGK